MLQTIKEYCVKNDFIVAEADLSPDRALIGNSTKKKGLATYRELMSNVSNKTNQSGRALTKVLESWVNNMFARAAAQMTQKSVLIVSHSNVSVDGVIKQVVKMLGTDKQSVLEDGKILRFGYVRDDELSQNPYATSFNYALSKCDSYAQKESLNEKEESFVNK